MDGTLPHSPSTFAFRSSPRLALALFAVTLGGMTSFASAGADAGWTGLAWALALLMLWRTWRMQVTRTAATAATALGVDVDGAWWLASRTGGARSITLRSAFVQRWGLIVSARDASGARHALLVAPDALPRDEFRRLAALLTMQAGRTPTGDDTAGR